MIKPASSVVTGKLGRILSSSGGEGRSLVMAHLEDGRTVKVSGVFVEADFRSSRVRLEGTWSDTRGGKVLRVESIWRGGDLHLEDPPLNGVEALCAEIFKGRNFGPASAQSLCEALGDKAWDALSRNPTLMSEVVGGEDRARELHSVLVGEGVTRVTGLAHFMGMGLSLAYARRILDELGSASLTRVRDNPYYMMKSPGIRFSTADRIARERMGVDEDDPRRLKALAVSVLSDASEDGHTSVAWADVVSEVRSILGEGAAHLDAGKIVADAVEEEHLVSDMGDIYLPYLWRAECEAADGLARLIQREPVDLPDSWESDPELASYTGEQVEAIAMGAAAPVCLINGRPGTGKTTVAREIVRLAHKAKRPVTLAATTGKAAEKLTESMAEVGLVGRPGQAGQGDLFGGQTLVDPAHTIQSLAGNKSPGKTLPSGVIIIDEASMMDLPLLARVVRNVRDDTSLVFLGDPNQLPPVIAGNSSRDIRDSTVVPTVELTRVHRQARTSLVNINAERILHGQTPLFMGDEIGPSIMKEINSHGSNQGRHMARADIDMNCFFIETKTPEEGADKVVRAVLRLAEKGFDPIRDVQVYTPMHERKLGTLALNEKLQVALNSSGDLVGHDDKRGLALRMGDPVIQTRNDRGGRGVVNGMRGVITDKVEGGGVKVSFGDRVVTYTAQQVAELSMAYATTVHKGQGQEQPATILALHHSEHMVMLDRSLLYVAQTRAKDIFVCVGSKKALWMCVQKAFGTVRRTRLAERTANRIRELEREARRAAVSPHLPPAQRSGMVSTRRAPKGRARPLVDRS
jgi:exodeoxyribonuclease V alpha subunit